MEYFIKISPVLVKFNNYFSTLAAWHKAPEQRLNINLEEAAKNNECLSDLLKLFDDYYVFLPKDLIAETESLFSKTILLVDSHTIKEVDEYFNLLHLYQNKIRRYLGTDEITNDLLKSIGNDLVKNVKLNKRIEQK